MLWYFMMNPTHYWVPMIINLVVLILNARFLGHLYKKGDLKLFTEPVLIFGMAMLWPLFDMFLLVGAAFWLAGKVIGFLVGKRG